jgi:hypothetical protein
MCPERGTRIRGEAATTKEGVPAVGRATAGAFRRTSKGMLDAKTKVEQASQPVQLFSCRAATAREFAASKGTLLDSCGRRFVSAPNVAQAECLSYLPSARIKPSNDSRFEKSRTPWICRPRRSVTFSSLLRTRSARAVTGSDQHSLKTSCRSRSRRNARRGCLRRSRSFDTSQPQTALGNRRHC